MSRSLHKNGMFRASRVLLLAMFALAFAGFVCQWIYDNSFRYAIDAGKVSAVVRGMTGRADATIGRMERILLRDGVDSLVRMPLQKNSVGGSTFLVYVDDELVFWSGNQTEPENLTHPEWRFSVLSNVLALTKSKRVGNCNIVVYVPLKYNFRYENRELQNVFVPALQLPKTVNLTANAPASKYAVFGSGNQYLFTLQPPDGALYVEPWATTAFALFSLAYVLLFIIFARLPLLWGNMKLNRKQFLIASAAMALFVFGSLFLGFPHTFFQNSIFTPYHYASGSFLSTLTHLSFLTAFLFALIYLLAFHVRGDSVEHSRFPKVERILLPVVPGAFFILIFNFLIGVELNSSTEISILRVRDITFVSLWNHLLFLVWGLGFLVLRTSTHRWLLRYETAVNVLKADIIMSMVVMGVCVVLFPKYGIIGAVSYLALTGVLYLPGFGGRSVLKSNGLLILWLFVFTLFVTGASLHMNKQKKLDKYRILTENHYNSEDTEGNRIAVSMLADLDAELSSDARIPYLAQFPDSILVANDYINRKYLRGFWSRYEMRFFGTSAHSEWDKAYAEEIDNWGRRVKSTHFYAMHNPQSDLAFLGVFRNNAANGRSYNYYMEFYPRKTFKSYSFPNLLMQPPFTIQNQLGLSSAQYEFGELVSASGKFKYRQNVEWITKKNEKYFKQTYKEYDHYIYAPDAFTFYILSEEYDGGAGAYILYFFYTLVIYLCIALLLKWLYRLINHRTELTYKFSSRYLMAFIGLLIVSFISIFYVSVNYMRQKYVDEQIQVLENTRNYIQLALQEKYYWIESLDSTMTSTLNFDLLDLSYMYQTDIHVYDNRGTLIGSSQPAIFSRGLMSKQLSPAVFFSGDENTNQYEKIGNLEYFTAYASLYNGDFLHIGYIAVPQFLTQDMLKADLSSFLTVIVHIYLIIIILFVVLSLLITRQLSSPLIMLQNSLKEMKIGQNKKIDYRPKDEIGQLVKQYNQTVDQLELSAQMLAQSERESAWKMMARQVAHEINNPLTPMKLTIQHLQHIKAGGDERFEEFFNKASQTLIEQIENLSRIASTFSGFAKLPDPKYTRVDVAKKLKSVSVLFANNAENIKITYRGNQTGAYVYADREQLILVFNNLMKNALQSIPAGQSGQIDLMLDITPGWVVACVKDNGTGIPDEIKSKLFTPNFTTKSTGMGLGLSISKSIINQMGGEITFDSTPGGGTTFKVILPRMAD